MNLQDLRRNFSLIVRERKKENENLLESAAMA